MLKLARLSIIPVGPFLSILMSLIFMSSSEGAPLLGAPGIIDRVFRTRDTSLTAHPCARHLLCDPLYYRLWPARSHWRYAAIIYGRSARLSNAITPHRLSRGSLPVSLLWPPYTVGLALRYVAINRSNVQYRRLAKQCFHCHTIGCRGAFHVYHPRYFPVMVMTMLAES